MIQFSVPGHDFIALTAAAFERSNKKLRGYFSLTVVFHAPEKRKINLVEKGRKVESLLCGYLYDKTSQIQCYSVRREIGCEKIEVTLT
ncbi:hypothetical protein M0R72_10710 [Candidatus Pacearchaeota archaeon]|jgi:uncharacterized membrane protein YbaN (DUF454 family)|nr:hypothetical protein [Candidatus Pacearchaeota archaeon]